MIFVRRLALLAWLFFPWTLQAQAQQCKVYFTVLESDPHLPGGSIAAMSTDQEKWWTKKGQKKYSSLCYEPSKATYQIVWWKQTVSDNFTAKNTADSRYDTTIRRTRDIASAYVKQVGAPEKDKPLFFADSDRRGTADALERSLKFLAGVSEK